MPTQDRIHPRQRRPATPLLTRRPLFLYCIASHRLVDDWGHEDIGYHNARYENLLRTPTLDALASAGVKLENYYVQKLCSPTRSALLSGRYTIHTGMQHGVIHPQQPFGLPTNLPTLADELRACGYATHLVGKWHQGFYDAASCPWNRGFDSTYGFLGGAEDHWTHTVRAYYDFRDGPAVDWAAQGTVPPTPSGDDDASRGAATNANKGFNASKHSTALFRARALDIIAAHDTEQDGNLFLYLPFQAVHAPCQAEPKWQRVFEQEAAKFGHDEPAAATRIAYAGMLAGVDEAVGAVRDALVHAGLWNDTVLVVSADNGGLPKNGGYNWPLRGQKATLWEGGVKAAGFVVAGSPALLPGAPAVSDALVHVSDWFPTLLSLAGSTRALPAGLDGVDVWDAVARGAASPRAEVLLGLDVAKGAGSTGFGDAALRVGALKLVTSARRGGGGDDESWALLLDGDDDEEQQQQQEEEHSAAGGNSTGNRRHRGRHRGRRPGRGGKGGGNAKNGWFVPPGCGAQVCPAPVMPRRGSGGGLCAKDTDATDVWLFNVTADPRELCNLAAARPADVARLMARLKVLNATAVPAQDPPNDPRALPKKGGAWGPWRK